MPIVCRWKSTNPAWRCRGSSNSGAAVLRRRDRRSSASPRTGADQLRRSSKSVCANLAEGFAKQSYSAAEYRRYLTVAIGSSDETQLWLRYCIDLGYIEDVVGRRWMADYVEISRMLQGLYASWSRSS